MRILKGKNIVLGVCGGIAAFKSIELLRLLKKEEAKVRVIMTRNAREFVAPLTFQALSGNPVSTGLFDRTSEASIRHIEWAGEADAVVVAPATANILGKLASGTADDALSTFLLAVTAPVILCPSMNTHMYENRAVQRNLSILKEDGYHILDPGSGQLACGTTGPGRLPEPEFILDRLISRLSPKDLTGVRIMVTAGPTWEPIDPVRYLGNPSSGKTGFAVARAAERRGGEVTLISGPVNLPDPAGVSVIRVRTAREMALAVFARIESAQIVIKVAAVSDYRPAEQAEQKIKKGLADTSLRLTRNPDILREIGERKEGRLLIGFAAETENLEENARKKMVEKNLDMVVGNLVNYTGDGFGAERNRVTLFYKEGDKESLPSVEKEILADMLLDRIPRIRGAKGGLKTGAADRGEI
jgi:phosphopantothenoylcysteine decarboxylase / phosphopantothenate---cysteine ligase